MQEYDPKAENRKNTPAFAEEILNSLCDAYGGFSQVSAADILELAKRNLNAFYYVYGLDEELAAYFASEVWQKYADKLAEHEWGDPEISKEKFVETAMEYIHSLE